MLNKVLVFESDPAFAGELRTEFGNLGSTVSVVDDGNVGLQQAAADKPDLILLSIELPRMNGFSVCNKLKKDPNLKDIPLIIMSSESSEETFDQHKKLRTRAEDYVHKPIAFGELLEHVQQFVAVRAPAVPAEGAIVIDDEIEVGSADYLIDEDATITEEEEAEISDLDVEPASGTDLGDEEAAEAAAADAEVDAITESAFDRLTGSRSIVEERVQAPIPVRNGSAAPPAPSVRTKVPEPFVPHVIPAPEPVPDTRGERIAALEAELEQSHREIEALRSEAAQAAKAAREVEDLRAKVAASARAGGAASREFLDLREALNKKDKEILASREQLSKKDREIVDAKERALGLERAMADVEDRLLLLERELTVANEKSEGLVADAEASKKTSDDLRGHLERLRVENETKERQIGELRAKVADDRAAAETKIAAQRADADQFLANERAEHGRALDQAEQRRVVDLEHARRERDVSVAEAREQASREIDALRTKHGTEMRALEESRDARIAALETSNLREVGESRGRIAELEGELGVARHDVQSLAEAKRMDDEAHDARISAVQKRLLDVQSARDDLEQRLTSAIAKRDSDKRSLERAKDALAVVLAQIEETETLPNG
jgi:DNA-binding response OmpR family regulator/chromosome segregation ATPase